MAFKQTKSKQRIKVLLFGAPGTGKTTAAVQAPGAAVFDLEEGSNFYSDIADFIVEDEKNPFKITESILELSRNPVVDVNGTPFKVKTVVIDPIHIWELNLEQQLVARRKKEERNPNYMIQPQDYKALKLEKKRLMSTLLNVDMNVFVCARTKDLYAPGKIMEKIGVAPDCDAQWEGYFDTILMLYFDPKRGNKRMAIVYSKDRTGKMPKDGKGNYIPFEWSYANFAEYIKGIDIASDSDAELSKKKIDESAGRFFETLYRGKKVKTAGVTGETLDEIAKFYADPVKKEKVLSLMTNAEISEPYDLTEDMAKAIIEEINAINEGEAN